jgi:hypothetical protein
MIFTGPATSYSCRGNPPTTIGAEELNFRVRDGNGCDLFAIGTRPVFSFSKTLFIISRLLRFTSTFLIKFTYSLKTG